MSSKVIKQSALATHNQTEPIWLKFSLTAGSGTCVAASLNASNAPLMIVEGGQGSTMVNLIQANVDALLGSTNEVLAATAFGSTAMVDNNTFGGVVDCGGQLSFVDSVVAFVDIAGTSGVECGKGTTTAFANSTFTGCNVFVTTNGNLAFRITYTNVSAAATAGYLFIQMQAKFK